MEADTVVHAFGVHQPNDPTVTQQWNLFSLGLFEGLTQPSANKTGEVRVQSLEPKAWDFTEGSDDVIVCIIDSGTDVMHPDLIGNLWVNEKEIPGNHIDDDGNGFVDDVFGYNFISNSPHVFDGIDIPHPHSCLE